MTAIGRFLLFALLLCFQSFIFSGIAEARERLKRELKFPKGGSFTAAVALASFLPKGPTNGLAHVLEFDLGFPFPEKVVFSKKTTQKKIWQFPHKTMRNKSWHQLNRKPMKRLRKKRNLIEKEKINLLFKIEDAITRVGFNGAACILRFQCELRTISPENSFLEEILLALFKTSFEPGDQKCEVHSRTCPISLLQVLMHSEQISAPRMI